MELGRNGNGQASVKVSPLAVAIISGLLSVIALGLGTILIVQREQGKEVKELQIRQSVEATRAANMTSRVSDLQLQMREVKKELRQLNMEVRTVPRDLPGEQ